MTNLNPEQVNQAMNILGNSKNILLSIPGNPTIDGVAASLALYLSLSASGKQVSIVSPTQMTVELNRLVGVDKITNNISAQSGRNLVISFPYQEGSIEKVSYNIDNDTFNLVIEPREGYPSITPEMMRYSYGNGHYDAVVTIGCGNPNDLGLIYTTNQNLFNDKNVINIDIDNNNSLFGKINLIDPTVSSLSELILGLMEQMGLPIEPDMATNLLLGMEEETESFSSQNTSAGTFEAAAILLKYGARKSQTESREMKGLPKFERGDTKQDQLSKKGLTSPLDKGRRMPFARQPGGIQAGTPPGFPSQTSKTRQQTTPQPPSNQQFGKSTQQQPQQPPFRESGKPPETPPDWLKPKIYKGSTLL